MGNKGYLGLDDVKMAYANAFSIGEVEGVLKEYGKNNRIYKDGFVRMVLPDGWKI